MTRLVLELLDLIATKDRIINKQVKLIEKLTLSNLEKENLIKQLNEGGQ